MGTTSVHPAGPLSYVRSWTAATAGCEDGHTGTATTLLLMCSVRRWAVWAGCHCEQGEYRLSQHGSLVLTSSLAPYQHLYEVVLIQKLLEGEVFLVQYRLDGGRLREARHTPEHAARFPAAPSPLSAPAAAAVLCRAAAPRGLLRPAATLRVRLGGSESGWSELWNSDVLRLSSSPAPPAGAPADNRSHGPARPHTNARASVGDLLCGFRPAAVSACLSADRALLRERQARHCASAQATSGSG